MFSKRSDYDRITETTPPEEPFDARPKGFTPPRSVGVPIPEPPPDPEWMEPLRGDLHEPERSDHLSRLAKFIAHLPAIDLARLSQEFDLIRPGQGKKLSEFLFFWSLKKWQEPQSFQPNSRSQKQIEDMMSDFFLHPSAQPMPSTSAGSTSSSPPDIASQLRLSASTEVPPISLFDKKE